MTQSSGSPDSTAEIAFQPIFDFLRGWSRPAWLVGGYVRDSLLRRATHDMDIAVSDGGVRLARALASAFGGAAFVLDASRDVGRALLPDGAGGQVTVDVARLRTPELLDDLAYRDFAINAIAMEVPCAGQERVYFDPFDGRRDLDRHLIRAVTEGTFRDDPLRMLRGVRLAAELGFRLEDATFNLIRRDAPLLADVAAERVRDELMRIVAVPGAWQHVRLLQLLGLLRPVLPEAAFQVGVAQSAPHYQDVFDHTRSVLAHLEGVFSLLWPGLGYSEPRSQDGDSTVLAASARWEQVRAVLAPYESELKLHLTQSLASGRDRRHLLMWAALTHDWGKPARRTEDETGAAHFYGHDHWGALLAEARMQALRLSGDETAYVSRLTELHMRPSHLARECPPTPRAIYRFYRAAGNTGVDCVLLSLADHLATRAASDDPEAWRCRAAATGALLSAYFRERDRTVDPPLLVDGNQVMALLNLRPGPKIGELLALLHEAQALGEVTSREEAHAWLLMQVR